jgi:hypothetical protein
MSVVDMAFLCIAGRVPVSTSAEGSFCDCRTFFCWLGLDGAIQSSSSSSTGQKRLWKLRI